MNKVYSVIKNFNEGDGYSMEETVSLHRTPNGANAKVDSLVEEGNKIRHGAPTRTRFPNEEGFHFGQKVPKERQETGNCADACYYTVILTPVLD